MGEKHILTVKESGKTIEVDEGMDLLTVFREAGEYVKSSCGGHASCTDCLIKITDGTDHLNAPSFEETQLLGNVFHITKERLACQTKISGPVTVDISSHDQNKDADKIRSKNNKFLKRRTKDEVDKMHQERKKQRDDKNKDRDSWKNHWQSQEDRRGKSTGGSKRPKTFRTDHLDQDSEEEGED